MDVVDHVRRIIVPHLGVDEHTLAPEALFRDGLGAPLARCLQVADGVRGRVRYRHVRQGCGNNGWVHDAIAHLESHVTLSRDRVSPVTRAIRGVPPGIVNVTVLSGWFS